MAPTKQMTSPLNWKDFLEKNDLPEDTPCLLFQNTLHVLVKVTGSDAESFLHAQLSNSVADLREGEVRFAAWCNAKGRVWTLLRYWKDADAIILRMPRDLAEDTIRRLRMFVMRSDVQLEALPWHATQLIGPAAEQEALEMAKQTGGKTYNIPLPAAWPLFELWSESPVSSKRPALPEKLSALPRILAGIPEVFASQREQWIPQMLNLDNLNGIDFKKGCYPGQEIVAKLHYKGGLKQRLHSGTIRNFRQLPVAGTEITDMDKNKVGTVIEASALGKDCFVSSVIRIDAEAGELTVIDQMLTGI